MCKILIYLWPFFLMASLARSAEKVKEATAPSQQMPKTERIGGTFSVKSITPLKPSGFQVEFFASKADGPYQKLILQTEHVHMGLREGAILRMSADVLAVKGHEAEISQVVVFVPNRSGENPVWMLSKHLPASASPPAKLLEMHAPASDFMVF